MAVSIATKSWTLDELHSLPDDGNKYELIDGVLYVTPAPTPRHEDVLARLSALLGPYVARERLGYVYHPRAVIRLDGSEVEPDLFVRQQADFGNKWELAPVAPLVVEVLSDSTRRRDHEVKRDFYLRAGVGEYWIIDQERRSITRCAANTKDAEHSESLMWFPTLAKTPLELRVQSLFERNQ